MTLRKLLYINDVFVALRCNPLRIKKYMLSSNLKHDFGRYGLVLEADAA